MYSADYSTCPFCGFDGMIVAHGNYRSSDEYFLQVFCPICGFERWTDGKDPTPEEVELAKQKLQELTAEEIEQVCESYQKDNVPLVKRSPKTP